MVWSRSEVFLLLLASDSKLGSRPLIIIFFFALW